MSFNKEFAQLTGNPAPLSWQTRLYHDWFEQGRMPEQLDLPTGLGKTSVMAIWLLARAAGVQGLPRRLVYVVDRRAVVDQATRFAERLRENLHRPEMAEMASRLGLGAEGLPISTLRGGFADNRTWLKDPAKPAIIVGTVDMIGSRLLFSGYGVSRRMRPYHAGLLGVDTLIVLDEAHLCTPFEELLRTIADDGDTNNGGQNIFGPRNVNDGENDHGLVPPFRLLSLSATGREATDGRGREIFRLNGDDHKDSLVKQRLSAQKQLKLHPDLENNKELVQKLADCALEHGQRKERARVLVYCDSRKEVAQEVKKLIDEELKKAESNSESELLVGARRIYERQQLQGWLERNGFLADDENKPQATAYLIATAAGEVGIDMDADYMVCDLVAWERMAQRLGRVNRRGDSGHQALVDVFAVAPDKPNGELKGEKKKEYERKLSQFNRKKAPLGKLPLVQGQPDRRDASSGALLKLKAEHAEIIQKATTPPPLYPALTRPVVESWSMTSLEKHTGRPEVAPWLRGWVDKDDPQTTIVWRKYLPQRCVSNERATVSPKMVSEFFDSAPMHISERLETESYYAFPWLLKRAAEIGKQIEKSDSGLNKHALACIILDRAGDLVSSLTFGELTGLAKHKKDLSSEQKKRKDSLERDMWNATIVVDARLGGISAGLLYENSKADIATATADDDDGWQKYLEDRERTECPMIKFRVKRIKPSEDGEGLHTPEPEDDSWKHLRSFETHFSTSGEAKEGLAVYKWRDATLDDEDARSILSKPQLLSEHEEQVAACARDIAKRVGLPANESDALEIAARGHDEGKAAKRWQRAMNAPSDWESHPYAKTKGGGNWRLLEGYRHEFGSMLKAEGHGDLPDETRDLILHLIVAHHGHARPTISANGCDECPSALEAKAGEVALRFAHLQKLYGPWGLAWREMLLRAADQRASSEWDQQAGKGKGDATPHASVAKNLTQEKS